RPVRPPLVVVACVHAQDMVQPTAPDDQEPVETLAADTAHPALDLRIRARRLDRGAGDPDAFLRGDRVAGGPGLLVPVVEQGGPAPAGRGGRVPRAACAPADGRPGRRCGYVQRRATRRRCQRRSVSGLTTKALHERRGSTRLRVGKGRSYRSTSWRCPLTTNR